MFKNKKIIFLIFLTIILIISISAVSAEDTSNLTDINNDITDINPQTDNIIINDSETKTEDLKSTVLTVPDTKYNTINYGNMIATLTDNEGNPLSNKTLNVQVTGDNKVYNIITNESGQASIKIIKTPKTYSVNVSFKGDDDYLKSEVVSKLIIEKAKTKITANTRYFTPKSGKYYTITLKNANNNVLVGKTVKIKLNGKTYTVKTNTKGQASIKIKLSLRKTYKVYINFAGDSKYIKSSKTSKVVVKKFKTKITANTATFIPKAGKYYTITLKDQYGNLLAKKILRVTINKKTYKIKTNTKGQAFLKINLTKEGKYYTKIRFLGTNSYYSSSKTSQIYIKKDATKITAENITCKAGINTAYTAILKNKNNTPIKNKKITLTLNGKTHTKISNSKGEVSFNLNMPSDFEVIKVYNAKLSFSGDISYLKTSKTIPITVISKENMFIDCNNVTTSTNYTYFKFRLYSFVGDYGNKPVKVSINKINKTYNLTTDEEGYCGFEFNESLGIYTVNIDFISDKIYKSAHNSAFIVVNKETTNVTATDVINAAIYIKSYADKNLRLPSEIAVGEEVYSMLDFSYMAGKTISNIYNSDNLNELIEVPNYVSFKTENKVVSKSLNSAEYKALINNYIEKCENVYNETNIWIMLPSIEHTFSGIKYSFDLKTLIYTYCELLNNYNTTGELPNKIMFKTSHFSPKTITMSNIIAAAKSVASRIDTGAEVNPKSIKINGYYYSADEFSYLLAKTIINIKNKKTSSITLVDVSYVESSENWKSININKKEYLSLASTLASKIVSTNTLPVKIKTSKGYADLEFYVYSFSNILKYYSSKKTLPSTAGVNTVYMYITGDDFKHGFNERNKETNLDKYLKTEGKSALNSAIKKLATQLTKGKSTWNKVKSIFNYVRDNVKYNLYYNSKQGAAKTLTIKKANCCDQTSLMIALLRASGIHARYAHSQSCHFQNGYVTGHVWGQALVGNVWIKLDTISRKNSIGVFKNINQKTTNVKTITTYALIPF